MLFFWINFIIFSKNLNRIKKRKLYLFNLFFFSLNQISIKKIRFSGILFSIFFLFFLYKNLWKLIPYTISVSSNILFTLIFRFKCWISLKLSRLFFKFIQYFSHFTPTGRPLLLIPFIKVIEVISNIIRPLTLGVRLAVNLLTGHLLLTLFCNSHISNLIVFKRRFFLLYFFGIFIFFYELCVCIVQALVYNLMVIQYFDEHSN
jgi:ATP synthase subunit 6